jgi:hypothetical protein
MVVFQQVACPQCLGKTACRWAIPRNKTNAPAMSGFAGGAKRFVNNLIAPV